MTEKVRIGFIETFDGDLDLVVSTDNSVERFWNCSVVEGDLSKPPIHDDKIMEFVIPARFTYERRTFTEKK